MMFHFSTRYVRILIFYCPRKDEQLSRERGVYSGNGWWLQCEEKEKEMESQDLLPRSFPPSSPFISYFWNHHFGKFLECQPEMDNIKRDVFLDGEKTIV